MSKKKNATVQSKNVNVKPVIVEITPEQRSIDDLAVMSDDELYAHLDGLFSSMKELRSQQSVSSYEQEICYAQRELQIRSARRRANDIAMSQADDDVFEDEDQYPEAELDNIEFVNLARRIEATRERARNRTRRSQTTLTA